MGQTLCPACGAEGLEFFPVLHHMICAYIGPQYDFAAAAEHVSEMPARRRVGRDRVRDRGNKRALSAMRQGNDRVAAACDAGRVELKSQGSLSRAAIRSRIGLALPAVFWHRPSGCGRGRSVSKI